MARKVRQICRKGKHVALKTRTTPTVAADLDTRIALIQALIPIGLQAFVEEVERELQSLVGARYAREGRQPGLVRWTRQRGSIYLGDQKLPVTIPRVRNRQQNEEVRLSTYERCQQPRALDVGLLHKVLGGLATRE